MKKEKFQGACANLQGHVFEAKMSQVNHIASYATTHEHIKTYVSQWYDPIVLETIKRMQEINLSEPQVVAASDGTMAEVKKIKFSKRLDCYFVSQERINKEKKQVHALFYR